MRISLSSARMSYNDISPEEKPMPTTSIAGDRASAVIAKWDVLGGDVRSEVAEKVCKQVLWGVVSATEVFLEIHVYILSTDIPQLHTSLATCNQNLV